MRFLPAVIMLGAGAYVFWYNSSQTSSFLMFPFLEMFFAEGQRNPDQMGRASAGLLAGLGAVMLFRQLVRTDWSRQEDDDG